jgi:hypothetical protein
MIDEAPADFPFFGSIVRARQFPLTDLRRRHRIFAGLFSFKRRGNFRRNDDSSFHAA